MTMEDLERIVAMAVKAALAAKTGTEKTKRSLDEKDFCRVDKFSSGTGWKEFAFQFRTAMGTADEVVREILNEIIKAGKDPDWLHLMASLADAEEKKPRADLYAIFTSVMTREAMSVVRGRAVRERVGCVELVGREVRSTDPSKVFDGHEARHAAEENQRREGFADSCPLLGSEGEELEGGARH